MKKVLVPVTVHTSPEQMRHAVEDAIAIYRKEDAVQIHLLCVQLPVSRHVSDCFAPGEMRELQAQAASEGGAGPRHLHWGRCTVSQPYGDRAQCRNHRFLPREVRCNLILMGEAVQAGMANRLFGNLASQCRVIGC